MSFVSREVRKLYGQNLSYQTVKHRKVWTLCMFGDSMHEVIIGNVPDHWPFVKGIHRSSLDFPAKGLVNSEFWCFMSCWPDESLKQTVHGPVISHTVLSESNYYLSTSDWHSIVSVPAHSICLQRILNAQPPNGDGIRNARRVLNVFSQNMFETKRHPAVKVVI